MTDPTEERLRRGLAELVRDKPRLGPVDLEAVMAARSRHPREEQTSARWLLVAAVLVVVVGLGVSTWLGLLSDSREVTAEPQRRPEALTGVRWLTTHVEDSPARPDSAGQVPSLSFDSNGGVRGTDPCNTVSGTYRLDGTRLQLEGLAATEIGCGDRSLVNQQSAYLRALATTASLRRDGPVLTLLNSGGSVVLRFRAADESGTAAATTVMVRVRNDAAVDFDSVDVSYYSGPTVAYGALTAGASSSYRRVGKAYGYSPVRVRLANGRVLRVRIFDYLGETLLPAGRYTYVLTINEDQSDPNLGLRLEVDQ